MQLQLEKQRHLSEDMTQPTLLIVKTRMEIQYHGSPTVVEKGNMVALAHETLESGANVFVAGTVFISDFEVKAEQDNIWDLPYLNKTIVENILGRK